MQAGPWVTSYAEQAREPTCEMSLQSLHKAGQMQDEPACNATPNCRLAVTMHWYKCGYFIHNKMFAKMFFYHSASLPAISRATNSYSIWSCNNFLPDKSPCNCITPKCKHITTSGFCHFWIRDPISIIVPF